MHTQRVAADLNTVDPRATVYHRQPQDNNTTQNNNQSFGWLTLYAVTSLSFAANAFCAEKGISPDKLADPNVFDNWSEEDILWGAIAAFCSFGINTVNHYVTYPKVKEDLREQFSRENSRKNISSNIFICLFALGAAVPAAYISYLGYRFFAPLLESTFLGSIGASLGYGLAGAIGVLSFLNFFALRTFGISRFIERIVQVKNYFQRSSKQQAYVDQLAQITADNRKSLNEKIQELRETYNSDKGSKDQLKDNEFTQELVKEILNSTNSIIAIPTPNNEKAINCKIEAVIEYLLYAIAAVAAVVGSMAILPVFAQKLFDGTLAMLDPLSGQGNDAHIFNPTITAAVICSIFSLATPILYSVQIFLLAQTLIDAFKSIADPNISAGHKLLKAVGLVILGYANYEACLGIFNVASGMAEKPLSLFGSTSVIGSFFSKTSTSGAVLAAGAACGVNTRFTVGLAMPPPAPQNDDTNRLHAYLLQNNLSFFSEASTEGHTNTSLSTSSPTPRPDHRQ